MPNKYLSIYLYIQIAEHSNRGHYIGSTCTPPPGPSPRIHRGASDFSPYCRSGFMTITHRSWVGG